MVDGAAAVPELGRNRQAKRVVGWLLVAAALFLVWTYLWPSAFGGPLTIITVTGESMEPGLYTGDVAVVLERDTYRVGDVVAFRSPKPTGEGDGAYIIHRITGGDATDGFVMRGDNNDWDDPWTPTADEIAGEMVLSVSGGGKTMRWISQPVHLAALLTAVAVSLVVAGGGDRDDHGAAEGAADDEEAVMST